MRNILLVEPDRILAKTYTQALEVGGHLKVIVATSAQAAITAADLVRPDMVVLELQLVEHSGVEFLYEFRSYPDWQTIPVIVHTIVPFDEFSSSWQLLERELGVRAYLYKPQASLRQLLACVKQPSFIAT